MSHSDSPGETPAASLAGSLTAFPLEEVLNWLASSSQSGELQVVSDAVDGRLWLANGALSNARVGSAATMGQAVFELACVADGSFYFTVGLTSSSGQPTVPVAGILQEVQPLIGEWREIRSIIPLDSVVALSSSPPTRDVKIRSDQWRVLTLVGDGKRTVNQVLDAVAGDQIIGLRSLRDLHAAGLVTVGPVSVTELPELVTSPDPNVAVVTPLPSPIAVAPPVESNGPVGEAAEPPPPSFPSAALDNGRTGGLAEVSAFLPPATSDPWAFSVESNGSGDGVA